MRDTATMPARLIFVVGASGSGKDSLLRYARDRLANESQVVFAHRYITRAADAGGENHIALTQVEFNSRCRAGVMALHWHSHGHSYGLGIEVDQWLTRGITVVVNGSRAHLETAAQRYPGLVPVWVEVAPEVLRARLLARGRECIEDIAQRLARAALQGQPSHRRGEVIHNEGELGVAGDLLVALVRHCANLPPAWQSSRLKVDDEYEEALPNTNDLAGR
jgi:ribose 1,5-bisphosphokinase